MVDHNQRGKDWKECGMQGETRTTLLYEVLYGTQELGELARFAD